MCEDSNWTDREDRERYDSLFVWMLIRAFLRGRSRLGSHGSQTGRLNEAQERSSRSIEGGRAYWWPPSPSLCGARCKATWCPFSCGLHPRGRGRIVLLGVVVPPRCPSGLVPAWLVQHSGGRPRLRRRHEVAPARWRPEGIFACATARGQTSGTRLQPATVDDGFYRGARAAWGRPCTRQGCVSSRKQSAKAPQRRWCAKCVMCAM